MGYRLTPVNPTHAAARRLLTIIAALVAVAALAPAAARSSVRARAARTFSISENGRLHLTSHHGFTLNEQGSATGTIPGTIYIHLNIVSTNRVTAEVNIYPSGGSLTGKVTAAYRASGAFNGTMTIQRGTGRYSHARGQGLSFIGTIRRIDDAVTVRVSGRMSA